MLNRVARVSHSRLAVESPIFIRVGNMSIMCVYRSTARTNECQSLGIDNSIRLQREPSNHATRTYM